MTLDPAIDTVMGLNLPILQVVDILAPGVNILSCWKGSKNATQTISGTSMGAYESTTVCSFIVLTFQATPHVAGIICCLLSNLALKDLATTEIMSQILIQADKNTLKDDFSRLGQKTINAVAQVNDL
jgi:subtilisin family serine protease